MSVWDTDTQEYHGGQEILLLPSFVEDFSVTTNALGPPAAALSAAIASMVHISHYPAADQEPARTELAKFLWPESWTAKRGQLVLSNGASEMIDLLVRMCRGLRWMPGPWAVQYMEYSRAATAAGKLRVESGPADLLCVVNPNNPTGEYMNTTELLNWVADHAAPQATVLVDESMQPWHSEAWREHSMLAASEQTERLRKERGVQIYVVHSWTKLWCCAGLRVGSVSCPTEAHARAVRAQQPPWSVNTPALAFTAQAVGDDIYHTRTRTDTGVWRAAQVAAVMALAAKHRLTWRITGEPWLSWLWVDVGDPQLAERLVVAARAAGTPVRHGRPGYGCASHLRLRVSRPEHFAVLHAALAAALACKYIAAISAERL